MLYAYIFLGAGILILSILFRLAAVFRLTIPLLYALVVPTLLSDWYYAHYTLANVIWYILLAVTALSWVYSLVRKISAIMERRRGKLGKDNTGQNDHTALQADGGVTLNKGHANAAGGLSCETGQRDGGDSRRHIEFEKTGIDGQNHDQRQNPDKQGSQECHRPQRDTLQKANVLDDGHHLVWQGRVGHGREAGGVHNLSLIHI